MMVLIHIYSLTSLTGQMDMIDKRDAKVTQCTHNDNSSHRLRKHSPNSSRDIHHDPRIGRATVPSTARSLTNRKRGVGTDDEGPMMMMMMRDEMQQGQEVKADLTSSRRRCKTRSEDGSRSAEYLEGTRKYL